MTDALCRLLRSIETAEADARAYDGAHMDQEAQMSDEIAEAARRSARKLIEDAMPGVAWTELKKLI